MLNAVALSSGRRLTNATPLAAGGTDSKRGARCSPWQPTDTSTARTIPRRMKIMPQDSAIKALSLVAALLAATMATGGCRSKPIDRQALLTAHYLGLTDLERGMLADAETQFKTVVANAPKDPLGYANLGLTYLRGGRFGEAEAQLKRARRLDPTNPEVALIAAKLYALTGRAAEARATLEALPRDAKVLYALARLDSLNPDRLRDVL